MPSTTYYKKMFLWTSANEGWLKNIEILVVMIIFEHSHTYRDTPLLPLDIIIDCQSSLNDGKNILLLLHIFYPTFLFLDIFEKWNEATTAVNIATRNFFQLVNKEEIKFLNVLISCIYFYLSSHYVYNLMLYLSPKYNVLIRIEMMQGVVHEWRLLSYALFLKIFRLSAH
jgi:hypothetical protein